MAEPFSSPRGPDVSDNEKICHEKIYYENLAGIKPAAPAFSVITMQPLIADGLKFVKASYESPYGLIVSDWKRQDSCSSWRRQDSYSGRKRRDFCSSWKKKDFGFDWKIQIPANTRAIVYIPARPGQIVKEGGQQLRETKNCRFPGRKGDRIIVEVGSGAWHFTVN